ncbi:MULTISPECIES: Tn7-like element transposition protein TnsE [Psychrobacter]|uniref:Transposon Tn7 transposition protein TnsE n=2 Tax=Psychrobacter TaxID=497 RepID=A0A1R4GWV8_9GAMM|nr:MULTISPECIES: Tn7-like element transposition protein TnsE [Psychrobacter]SJM37766.1 Transposon Tn7 transposition protein TnsE [Psychrobacter pasteurii]SJM72631.1 Transposon Tn7 transposition protein TnsE [Psychrobacter piechaudii]
MKVKGYPEDAQIRYIANIFKFKHLKSWNLELCIKSEDQDQILHTRLSNLPAIAKRRIINPSDGQSRKGGYPLILKDISTFDWQVGIDLESGGNTFVFDYVRSGEPRVTVHIPQIEFARVLFFHNAYLAQNCRDHGILTREFRAQDTQDDSVLVNVSPASSLPLKVFENEGQRRLLAWILLDDNARHSYESIAKHFINDVKDDEDKKVWVFQFDPPQLESISLETTGWMDKKTGNYHVYEIIGISNIPSSLTKKVQFFSERFKVGTGGGGKSSGSQPIDASVGDTIDDQQEADVDTKSKTIDIPTTSFSFARPVETRKVVKKRVPGAQGDEAEEYDELVELGLSTDEATIDGTACQADFSGLDDDSDVLELYMQRFEAFKLLIKRLSEQPNIYCTEKLHFLPAVGRSRLHRTIDGNRRSVLEVIVKTESSQFVILEIDTTDNSKSVSTLLIEIEDIDSWNAEIDKILRIIVKRSLRWPKISYLERYGTVRTLNHPQDVLELTEDSDEFISWQRRLCQALGII